MTKRKGKITAEVLEKLNNLSYGQKCPDYKACFKSFLEELEVKNLKL